jgi:hypothetical protein
MCLAALVLLAGCSDPTSGRVEGSVFVDGTPAKAGSIAFFPVDPKSSTAGAEIVDGRYSATVRLGTFKVEIRVPKVVGEKKLYDTANSPVKKVMAESLPARYNDATELTLDVKPGDTQHDFRLTTQ